MDLDRMAHARVRDDRRDSIYKVGNALIGPDEGIQLGRKEIRKLDLFVRQLDRLYCIDIITYTVTATSYLVVCRAPAELPSKKELEEHFVARYGSRREMPAFHDYHVYLHWAKRLRNISCFFKDLEQRFTQWYNRIAVGGRRRGTIWRGRFWSQIMRKVTDLAEALKQSQAYLGTSGKCRGNVGKLSSRWDRLRHKHPLLGNLPYILGELARDLPREIRRSRRTWGYG